MRGSADGADEEPAGLPRAAEGTLRLGLVMAFQLVKSRSGVLTNLDGQSPRGGCATVNSAELAGEVRGHIHDPFQAFRQRFLPLAHHVASIRGPQHMSVQDPTNCDVVNHFLRHAVQQCGRIHPLLSRFYSAGRPANCVC